MEITKKPYEISLWEDELISATDSKGNPIQYYKEIKIAIIGSDTMDSPARCVNPKLTRKVNGENTFVFTMYYRYWDSDAGDFVYNPFNGLMVNERKVKLRIGEPGKDAQWFDFIIKNVQENSESKAFTYTCKDQFINELSKSGFEIVLDNELENNMGTVEVLAERVLQGSDWQVLSSEKDLKQYKEEPLYKVQLGAPITAINMLSKTEITIPKDENIYVFYSNINDKKPQWQFLYTKNDDFEIGDDLVIDRKHDNYEIKVVYSGNGYPAFVALNANGEPIVSVSTNYRGERLIRQTQTKYDATIDKYVGVYEKDGKQYYGFTQSEYVSSGAIVNYVANPSNFISTSGWQTDANQLDYVLNVQKNESINLYESFIEVNFANKNSALVMNAGIGGNRSVIGEFVKGEKYMLRMKYKESLEGEYKNTAPIVKICVYDYDDKRNYAIKEELFSFSHITSPAHTNDIDKNGNYMAQSGYVYAMATCSRSVSKTELSDWDLKIGLFFDFDSSGTIFIEDVQVFRYETYTDDEVRLCVPGGRLNSEIKTKYVYYTPSKEMESINDLEPAYSDYQNDESFVQQYGVEGAEGNEFTKVRSISAKESNRFNLIQQLCETFECWPKIVILRNETTGEISHDKDYRQQKFIGFEEFVGKENFAGFRYGINSKSIQRTIDSAAIVTKMIVKDNANEFAPNGFCSIARASENPTGENFLLNFDHYIRQGLLDFDIVTNDLYVTSGGYLGYYTKLKEQNIDRNRKIDKQAGLLIDISNFEAAYTTYKTSYDNAVSQQLIVEKDLYKLIGKEIPHDDLVQKGVDDLTLNNDQQRYWNQWCQYQNVIVQHEELFKKAKENLDSAKKQFDDLGRELEQLTNNKRELAIQFYKKYSRFIQEGSWIKDDYTDPNLYYLDSESTLHTSAQPKVTYNISVIDVAPLAKQEGYEYFAFYNFDIGDKTYIEDVEFFGWSLRDRSAPYREEIVVSEITTELDAPEKSQFKVQNYKTQFEDLFQRITAQTQQAEYHTGEYARAAGIVETNGTISADTLANSFANNSFKLSNARDQSVVWDSSGITTTSLANPSEMVRIISGGVFLSTDGGQSWKTGITGSGINTSYLTAGQINTDEIYIMNGANAAFRWDNQGLAAYDKEGDFYNQNKFVRFDHNGIYGYQGETTWVPNGTEEIHQKAPFALTWDGFSLQNEDGSVRISTKDDIQVLTEGKERLKIGRLEEGLYGIRISNKDGESVMETGSDGNLWLKNKLQIGDGSENSSVQLGVLGIARPDTIGVYEVFHAGSSNEDGPSFVVYDDGTIAASGALLSGRIDATGGTIGPVILSEDGLQIRGKGFEILDAVGEKKLLHFDGEKLCLSGIEATDGFFKGKIEATSGSFKGKIEATDATFEAGNIGGFLIGKGKLSSVNGKIILDGAQEKITANEIELGTGATISEYIKLGNAFIRNPDKSNKTFIESKEIKVLDNGTAYFGGIEIDGKNSEIKGVNFSITPEEANFQNVTVKGKISTSIFEKGSTQVVGGSLLFNDSYRIISYNTNYDGQNNITGVTYNLDQKPVSDSIKQNDLVLIVTNTTCKQRTVKSIIDKSVTVYGASPDGTPELLVVIGAAGGLVMGINSSNSTMAGGALFRRGLTLREANSEGYNDDLPSLFLGDLGALGSDYKGYGLYADNVHLRGSLTTLSTTGKSAGINTTSGVKGLSSIAGDDSSIIFWAGANDTSEKAIQEAPFHVTEDGYIYARQAKMECSIFAKGEIIGATLKAAEIRGWSQPSSGDIGSTAALSIYDADRGIGFYKDGVEEAIFSIGSLGFQKGKNTFISIDENKVDFSGTNFVGENLQVKGDGGAYLSIGKYNNQLALYHYDSDSNNCGLYFGSGVTTYRMNGADAFQIAPKESTFFGTLRYKQDQQGQLEYRPNGGGYDLYVVSDGSNAANA